MSTALTKVASHLHRGLGRYLDRHSYKKNKGKFDLAPNKENGEKEDLASLLDVLGHHNKVEPLAMLEVFLSSGEHLSITDFLKKLHKQGLDVSEEKAQGVLELFTSLGFAVKNFTEEGKAIYEHSRPGLHHDHIICSGCACTVEFNRPDVDGLIEKISCDEDFCHLDHRLVVYGLCPTCRRRRHEGLPLAETSAGESVVVVDFKGDEEIKKRLGDLGLHKGSRFKVLGTQAGSVIVFFDSCRLALGAEMAAGLIVRARGKEHHRHFRQNSCACKWPNQCRGNKHR